MVRGAVIGKRAGRVAAVLAAGFAAFALSGAAGAAGPPAVAFQINVAHTGVQTDPSLVAPFVKRWQVNLPAPASFPIIAQGNVYETVDNWGQGLPAIYALDQLTGQTVWSRTIPVGNQPANTAYDDGRLFVVSNDGCCDHGVMSALDAATGALLWTTPLPGQYEFISPPVASAGVVYAGGLGSGGTLYALDEITGSVLASQPVFGGESTPALAAASVFGGYGCNFAYAFSQLTLSPLWTHAGSCFGGDGLTPAYADGRLFMHNYGPPENLILDAATGTTLRTWGRNILGAPAVDSTALYWLSPGQVTAEDPATGAVRWTFTGDGTPSTPPIVLANGAGGLVVEGSNSGNLYALDPATGSVVWTTSLGVPIPYPIDGTGAQTQSGLGAGEGLLVVPAGQTVFAFAPQAGTACPPHGSVATRWHYSADGAKGKWSATKTTSCTTGDVTIGPQAMEGDLKVDPGTTIQTGYDLQLPGNKHPYSAAVANPAVVFQLRCVSGAPATPSTLTVAMPRQSYPVTGSEWEPTGDQQSSLGYQGSATIPDACGGSRVRLDRGGTFSANVKLF